MRTGLLLLLLSFVLLTGFHCSKNKPSASTCFKGRLELKGVCMNYTIKILEGHIDPALINTSWTNPATNTTYQNVFALASVCDFPSNIAQGDEFYFSINPKPGPGCAVCEAYYPTPPKKLVIIVWKTPCSND